MDYIQEWKNVQAKPQLPAVWKRLTCPVTGCLATGREMAVDKRRSEPMIVAIERPDVEQFLNAPLTSPATRAPIAESRHEDARTSIGKAYCRGGVPAIHYAPDVDTVFSPISFAFIRAHELAHINLRHVRCDGDRPREPGLPSPRERELAADCEASKIVQRLIPRGETIVAEVAGQFYALDWKETDYPATRMRHDRLWSKGC
jgi:hypothetical protein